VSYLLLYKIWLLVSFFFALNKNINQNKFNKCGVYQLTCHDCNRKYIGQTGSPFYVRFQEHFRDFQYGNGVSKFAQHLLDNKHSIAPMEDIMEILRVTIKGSMRDTLIYNVTRRDNHINDKCTVKYHAIFDKISHKNSYRVHSPPKLPVSALTLLSHKLPH
jgi:hypothetical protein